jgi:tetratricopeptide (TPR) repeat protein
MSSFPAGRGVVCQIGTLAIVFAASAVLLRGQESEFERTYQLGVAAMKAAQWEAAVDQFTRATSLRPGFAGAYFNLGLAQMQEKSWEEALKSFTKALKLDPDLRGADMFAGIASYRLNDNQQAIAFLERGVKLQPASATGYMWLGVAQLAVGDAEAAAANLDKAAKLKPNDVDILYHRGRAHMLISKSSYEEMYKADPNSWRVHEVLAQSFREAERYGDAINECKEALQLKPDEPGLHEELADIYWKQNQLPQAEEEFQAEIKGDPEDTTAMYKLAVVSIERSKPEVAVQLLAQVLARTPHSADAHYQLGRAQAQLGQSEAAIESFNLALTDSGDARGETVRQTYYQLAQLYRRVQRPEESRAALNSFLRLKQEADAEQTQKLQDKLKRSVQLQEAAQ